MVHRSIVFGEYLVFLEIWGGEQVALQLYVFTKTAKTVRETTEEKGLLDEYETKLSKLRLFSAFWRHNSESH